ncbi:hypothetical protein ACJRO7_011788 [Eucalyptus globulus]|uniref:GH18 domain-containing protein n=1 Tax=Eucalyptus globulus TaxID=34317 RepID=A0ABD3LR86_EUCGL
MEFRSALSRTLFLLFIYTTNAANTKLFHEYIGAESDTIQLSDVPEDNPSPTSGKFNVFWETNNLIPSAIASFKQKHPKVKFAVSLGGDSIGRGKAFFDLKSTNSWAQNAISSLTGMIKKYHLNRIDIDYEHFKAITRLKKSRVTSLASIAPHEEIQTYYLALWNVSEFLVYYKQQASNFEGGQQVPASLMSKGGGGLQPNGGFFQACNELKSQGKLGGIFHMVCADDSIGSHFQFEKQSQQLLAA